MAPMTRAQAKDIRNYLIRVMLDAEGETKFSDGLDRLGVRELDDLTSMNPSDIDSLKFATTDPTSPVIVLRDPSLGDKRKVLLLLQWLTMKKLNSEEPLTLEQWNSLEYNDFSDFRVNLVNPFEQSISAQNNRFNANDTIDSKQKQEIETFKRSIKRDATIYPTLREDSQWDSWNRSTLTLARTHDVSEIFDENYIPSDELSKVLFTQKQAFVYSVFNRVILTDMGKTIVRKYEDVFDAQSVYKDLVTYAKRSTAANINIENIVQQLHLLRLDTRWNGTNKGFILNWRDKMRLYEELTPKDEHYTDANKKRMLETCVNSILELRQVKTQDEHARATGGVALTYLEYVELLLSAATRRDAELKLPPQRSRRNINIMETNYELDQPSNNLDDYINYNTYADDPSDDYVNYSINVADSNFIPREVWQQLPQEVRLQLIKSRKPNNGHRSSNNRGLSPRPTNAPKLVHKTNLHVTEDNVEDSFYECGNEFDIITNDNEPTNCQHNVQVNKSEQAHMHPGDIRNVLTTASKATKKPSMQANTNKRSIVIDGVTWYSANTTVITYSTFSQRVYARLGSLVDRGANGGIAGDDVMLIESTHRTCNVSGIDNHTIKDLPIVACAGLVKTTNGYVIVILNQYAYSGKGNTIHSSAQIEFFGNLVDDKSKKVGGKQHIVTLDNYTLDLSIQNGLVYLDMSKPTKDQFDSLPHVVLTSDSDWNPSVLDHEKNNLGELDLPNNTYEGNLCQTNITYSDYVDNIVDNINAKSHKVDVIDPKFDLLQPNFGYSPVDVIKKTFECTTQWARMVERYPFRKHFKSRFPALNVTRRNEHVATDTIFSDTPSLESNCYLAQIFVGTKTIVTDVYPMKYESDFPNALKESIRHRGAMSKLISDYAKVETSAKVKDILRHYCIQDWQSEPYHQHQNAAERRYQTIKRYTSTILDRTGAPPETWLLVLKYVCYVLNLTYVDKLGTVPLEKLTGQTQDISILLPFSFWEPVYYATGNALGYNASVSFPSHTAEGKGHFVGFGESVGDALTFLVLTNDTQKLLYRSSVRSANTTPPNLRLDNLEGEMDNIHNANNANNANNADIDLDSSFPEPSLDKNKDNSFYTDLNTKFYDTDDSCYVDDHLMLLKDYNKVLDNLESVNNDNPDPEDNFWKFDSIVGHQGPLYIHSPGYKGSLYNILIKWEDGTESFEPLNVIAEDNPIACAHCAHYAKDMPRTSNEAYDLDKKLGQTKWTDAINTELEQIHNYETFKNLGKDAKPPDGYKKIRVRFVFDIKHDGRHKARLVAGGHLTDEPDDSVYSSVVSLRDLRLVIFAGEQNNLDVWGADVGNAYLESYTKEKVYIVAGPEFAELEGCVLQIDKALYGLRSSGLRWHERFADTLRDLGFKSCKASPDVWMRPTKDYYEYIAVYVDDLAIVAKDPKAIVDTLETKYNYKLKGVGPIDYHLGGNFGRDEDNTLTYGPRKYIDKLIANYVKQFGNFPVERISPLEHGDHPELDDSPELEAHDVKLYQSMIGALQHYSGQFP